MSLLTSLHCFTGKPLTLLTKYSAIKVKTDWARDKETAKEKKTEFSMEQQSTIKKKQQTACMHDKPWNKKLLAVLQSKQSPVLHSHVHTGLLFFLNNKNLCSQWAASLSYLWQRKERITSSKKSFTLTSSILWNWWQNIQKFITFLQNFINHFKNTLL